MQVVYMQTDRQRAVREGDLVLFDLTTAVLHFMPVVYMHIDRHTDRQMRERETLYCLI